MHYINAGGPFMWPLVLIALVLMGLSIKKAIDLFQRTDQSAEDLKKGLQAIWQLGLFCFFWGLLSQAVGLYQMLSAVEAAGDVSPALLAGGLKVSLIAPIFGLIILVVSLVVWFLLQLRYRSLIVEVAD
ncbi:MAG TPA: MotA/TolQ/ExbB proton channel family protein [Rhodothermales bacterium]|nr:MotA/TolQ/ExbB proton channel family protein [Rhodothermales bacterium]